MCIKKDKRDIKMNFMYNYVDCIVKFIWDTCETLTGLTCLEWSCNVIRLMFHNLFFSPFVVGFVRAKASVRPHILDVVVMYDVVKGGVFEFIGRRFTKNCMVLCDLHQYWC